MTETRVGPYVKIDGKWQRDWAWKGQWNDFARSVQEHLNREESRQRLAAADAWIDAHVRFHPASLGQVQSPLASS